jgi:hypothetical protein
MSIRSYQYRVRKGYPLHSCGNIGRIAKYVHALAGTHAYHYRTGVDTDPRGQFWRGLHIELRDSLKDRQTGARSTLGIVVVSFRPAEIGHHPVTLILSDITAELGYGFRCGTTIRGEDLAPFFGIESSSNLC